MDNLFFQYKKIKHFMIFYDKKSHKELMDIIDTNEFVHK